MKYFPKVEHFYITNTVYMDSFIRKRNGFYNKINRAENSNFIKFIIVKKNKENFISVIS